MIRAAAAAALAAALSLASVATASAGHMHQSPLLRKNHRMRCPDGKPMRNTRSGRAMISAC